MIIIDSIMSSVRALIASGVSDSQTQVRFSYDRNVIANPIRKTYIIINPAKIVIMPYDGGYGSPEKKISFRIGFNIHQSESGDRGRLFRVFSETVTTLDDSPLYEIDEAGCGEIKSDSDSNSVYLPCYVEFTVLS